MLVFHYVGTFFVLYNIIRFRHEMPLDSPHRPSFPSSGLCFAWQLLLSHEGFPKRSRAFCFMLKLPRTIIGSIVAPTLPTMLQKLSKCEVLAWLYWNLIILLPLRFCVKSNFVILNGPKISFFVHFRDSKLWILVNLGLENCSYPKSKLKCWKLQH